MYNPVLHNTVESVVGPVVAGVAPSEKGVNSSVTEANVTTRVLAGDTLAEVIERWKRRGERGSRRGYGNMALNKPALNNSVLRVPVIKTKGRDIERANPALHHPLVQSGIRLYRCVCIA